MGTWGRSSGVTAAEHRRESAAFGVRVFRGWICLYARFNVPMSQQHAQRFSSRPYGGRG